MAEMNEAFLAAAGRNDQRFMARRHVRLGEHFGLEAAELRALPAEPLLTV